MSYNATTLYDRHRRLQGVFAAARDITERKHAEAQILSLALHDSLTRLPNRRQLTDRLGQTLATGKRSGRYSALIFLDMDAFKSLNDTLGHMVGDLLLIEVAGRLGHCVREVDFVARFGGDEFVVILSELDADLATATQEARLVAEKIRASLSRPYVLNRAPEGKAATYAEHRCTSSIGVLVFLNQEQDTDELIRQADMAMYRAKETGGNTICYCEAP